MAVRVVANGPNGYAFFGWIDDLDLASLRTTKRAPATKVRTREEGFNQPHRASPGFVSLRVIEGEYEIQTWFGRELFAKLKLQAGDCILFMDVEEGAPELKEELRGLGAYAGHRGRALTESVVLQPEDVEPGQIDLSTLNIRASVPKGHGLVGLCDALSTPSSTSP